MKLRNGKQYISYKKSAFVNIDKVKKEHPVKNINDIIDTTNKTINKPTLTIDKNMQCSICAEKYKKNDIICSCSINNINKHSYHKECIKTALKYMIYIQYSDDLLSKPSTNCPYCNTSITYKSLKFVKIA